MRYLPTLLAISYSLICTTSLANITWNLTYDDVTNNTGVGFDDPLLGATRQAQATQALDYISSQLNNTGSIDFRFSASQTDGTGSLASAQSLTFRSPNGFDNGFAFAHGTTGIDPLPTSFDPTNFFKDSYATIDFGYKFNSDSSAPEADEFDLFTTILHETTHAMGFTTFIQSNSLSGLTNTNPGVYTVYDSFLEKGDGSKLLTTGGQFIGAIADLTSADLYFGGAFAKAANKGQAVQIHAPPIFRAGASISHLDNRFDSLMNFTVPPGYSQRTYNTLELAILSDLGWSSVICDVCGTATHINTQLSMDYDGTYLITDSTAAITIDTGITLQTNGNALIYLTNLGDGATSGNLINRGSLIATNASNGETTGVRVFNELLGKIDNHHLIKSEANETDLNAQAKAIWETGTPAMQGIINNHTGAEILAAANNQNFDAHAIGIHLENNVGLNAQINNDGKISAIANSLNTATANAIKVDGEFLGTINNTANGELVASTTGDQSKAIAIEIQQGFYGNLINNGKIVANTNDNDKAYALLIQNGAGGLTGNIQNTENAQITGRIAIYSPTNVSNAGRIDLPTHSSDLGISGYIKGDFEQTNTGILGIVTSANSAGNFSQLTIESGNANIAGQLAVDIRTINSLSVGQTFSRIIDLTNNGQLTGNFSSITDNSNLYNFVSHATEGSNGSIDLEIVQGISASQSSQSQPANAGAANFFEHLSSIGGQTGDMQTIMVALGQQHTEQDLANAISQTLPLLTGGASNLGKQIQQNIHQVIQTQQGISSGEQQFSDDTAWVKAFGSWAKQDNVQGISGYDADTYGLVIGTQAMVNNLDQIGFAFAYATSDIQSHSTTAAQQASVDLFSFISYASHPLKNNDIINWQIDIGQHSNKGQRQINFGGLSRTAKSNYTTLSAHAGIDISRNIWQNHQNTLTTSLSADASFSRDESYSETGAGALNLTLDSNIQREFIIGFNNQLKHLLNDQQNLTAQLGIGYDLIGKNNNLTATFAGSPSTQFITQGISTAPWLVNTSISYQHQITDQLNLNAEYDITIREHFMNQTASIKLSFDF